MQDKLDQVLPRPVGTGWNTVKAVHRLVLSGVKPLPARPDGGNAAQRLAMINRKDWASHEWTLLCGLSPIWTDAAGFAVTAFRLCIEVGVPEDRMAIGFVATPEERERARQDGRKCQVDHVVCLFMHEDGYWRVIADGTQVCFEARVPVICADVYRLSHFIREGVDSPVVLAAAAYQFDGYAPKGAPPRREYFAADHDRTARDQRRMALS